MNTSTLKKLRRTSKVFKLFLLLQIFQSCNLQAMYRQSFKNLTWLKGNFLTLRLNEVKVLFDSLEEGEVSTDERLEKCTTLKDLVNKRDKKGSTPLVWAAFNCEEGNTRLLLSYGADPNIANSSNKKTPLNIAAGKGYTDIVNLLLSYNADPNIKDNRGKTALSWAAGNGHHKIVEKLITKNADVNISDKDGQTALHWAASNGHSSVVELLLDNNANINFQDKKGGTALSWAAFNNKKTIVELLLQNKANPNLAIYKDKMSALHWASDKGFLDIVKFLVYGGADSNLENKNGETPLSLAAFRGMRNILVHLLKNSGASFSSGKDKNGMNVLMLAIQSGNLWTVKTVIHYLNFYKIMDPFREVDQHRKRTVLAWLSRMHPRASAKNLNLFSQNDFDALFKHFVENYLQYFDLSKQDIYGGSIVYWLSAVGDYKNLTVLFDAIKSSDVYGERKIIELLYTKNGNNSLTPLSKVNAKINDINNSRSLYRNVNMEQMKTDLYETTKLIKSYLNVDPSSRKRKANVVVAADESQSKALSEAKEFKRHRYGIK